MEDVSISYMYVYITSNTRDVHYRQFEYDSVLINLDYFFLKLKERRHSSRALEVFISEKAQLS